MAMVELDHFWTVPYIFILLLLFLTRKIFFSFSSHNKATSSPPVIPGTYPIVGSYLAIGARGNTCLDWFTSLLRSSPTSTITIHRPFGAGLSLCTANPANVEHILKTRFSNYPKGPRNAELLGDLLGEGIFNADGESWKFQRQVASHEFSTNSLRKFVEQVVDTELSSRLIPILEGAAENGSVLDLQDLLKRFAFDNVCMISFGYDPELLLPSLPEASFASAFEEAMAIISTRLTTFPPVLWKIKRFLNVGSERNLKRAVSQVRDLAQSIVRRKMREVNSSNPNYKQESQLDLLSRFLKSGHSDEQFVTDIVISFIIAGRDTTSAALTWFFWLLTKHQEVEQRIFDEIRLTDKNSKTSTSTSTYDEVKRDLIYTHASLFESMRLYPPVAFDMKQAIANDIWPDGTKVVAGTTVSFNMYAMGRMERIWGEDWAEFKPERWLREEEGGHRVGKMGFVGRDPYSYPVFQAGPRTCLGKDMAVMQMKRVVSGVLQRFRVVPAVDDEFKPVLLPQLTIKMEGGFLVQFKRRG